MQFQLNLAAVPTFYEDPAKGTITERDKGHFTRPAPARDQSAAATMPSWRSASSPTSSISRCCASLRFFLSTPPAHRRPCYSLLQFLRHEYAANARLGLYFTKTYPAIFFIKSRRLEAECIEHGSIASPFAGFLFECFKDFCS